MTKEEKLLQSIENLERSLEELQDDGATAEAMAPYEKNLEAARSDLALLRHTRRQQHKG